MICSSRIPWKSILWPWHCSIMYCLSYRLCCMLICCTLNMLYIYIYHYTCMHTFSNRTFLTPPKAFYACKICIIFHLQNNYLVHLITFASGKWTLKIITLLMRRYQHKCVLLACMKRNAFLISTTAEVFHSFVPNHRAYKYSSPAASQCHGAWTVFIHS